MKSNVFVSMTMQLALTVQTSLQKSETVRSLGP